MRNLHDLPRVRLGVFPTPFYRLDRLSEQYGRGIWIKRDDLCGVALGGSKVRKLEFVLAEALDQGCDTVFTTGGAQSNHAALTAACAARLGMKCILLLKRRGVTEHRGNLVLDELFGAEVRLLDMDSYDEIYAEMHRIGGTLEQARAAVARIVGRDTAALSAGGVTKAAVETVAENFADGVAAPMFYMLLGGAPLALCYKAVNTMDSMVGYKNERYLYFGRAAAKLDDAANYLPARMAALLLAGAAALTGQNARGALRIWRRDRRSHASPNSAQTEAVMAGALGVQLAGPASYFGKLYEKPTIGDALRPVEPGDILRANRMLYAAGTLCMALLACARAAVCLPLGL